MDTKSKNIKYKLRTKTIAAIVLWISAVVVLTSAVFLLSNSVYMKKDNYEQTYQYEGEINRLIHNVIERGTRFGHGTKKEIDSSRYNIIENNLSNAVNFNFYMKDLNTGKTYSKMSDDYTSRNIKEDPNAIHISLDGGAMLVNSNNRYFYLYEYDDIEKMLKKSPQDLYVVVSDPPLAGDIFYDMYTQHTAVKYYTPYVMGALVVSLMLLVISLGFLVLVSGKEEKDGEIYLSHIDRIYNDIQSVFVLVAALMSMIFISISNERYSPEFILIGIVFAIDIVIGMTYFFSMLRQFKKGVLFKNTLVYKMLNKIVATSKGLFNDKIFKPWIIGLFLIYGVINGWLFSIGTRGYGLSFIGGILIIGFNFIAIYFAFEKLKSLSIIMNGAKEISKGDLDYKIDDEKICLELKDFAKDIQSIQGGLKNAVEDAVKGERMKTDLITNVSHDLKTPLTSIINYVDLLKQEDLDNENANTYLEVLDEKSYRLKQLIEDLIEASKASSGNLVVTTDKVDLEELITQALGEYEDKISEAKLEVITKSTQSGTLILADGKLMWRIIENIMSNALKYSMENSRLYIDINEKDGYGQLVMKNISAYPLDIDPEELTDRFIRADMSRTTEGSGLGLSIAQSLTSMQNGRFNIDIDGDLFKVTIDIPLYK